LQTDIATSEDEIYRLISWVQPDVNRQQILGRFVQMDRFGWVEQRDNHELKQKAL